MIKIYLGLTTIWGSDWKGKIREIDDLGISEIALFPTVLEAEERKRFYDFLKKSSLKKLHLFISGQIWRGGRWIFLLRNTARRFLISTPEPKP